LVGEPADCEGEARDISLADMINVKRRLIQLEKIMVMRKKRR
jgi:hypothetical protein